MDEEPITFEATIPPLQSAIQVDGAGGCRVKIDIPETELPAIARLLLMRGRVLTITVSPRKTTNDQTQGPYNWRGAKRPTDSDREALDD